MLVFFRLLAFTDVIPLELDDTSITINVLKDRVCSLPSVAKIEKFPEFWTVHTASGKRAVITSTVQELLNNDPAHSYGTDISNPVLFEVLGPARHSEHLVFFFLDFLVLTSVCLVITDAETFRYVAIARHYLPNSFKDYPAVLELPADIRDSLPARLPRGIIKHTRKFSRDLKVQKEK
jgi:hypothetical protein